MNIKPPLAAALLMLASTAMAQPYALSNPFNCGSPYSFSLSAAPSSPLMLTGGMPDIATFNCSTPCNMNWGDTDSLSLGGVSSMNLESIPSFSLGSPTVSCTPEQERARAAFTGACSAVSLSYTACLNYRNRLLFPRYSNFSGPQQQGEVDGAAAVKAAAAAKPTEAASSVNVASSDGGFTSSSADPEATPGATEAQDRKAFEKAQEQVGKDGIVGAVPLPDGHIAMMRDDGTAEICDRSSKCADPVPASTLKNQKIVDWVANNNAGYNQNGGINSLTNPSSGSKGAPDTAKGSQGDSNTQTSPSDEARRLGGEIPPNLLAMNSSGMKGASAGGNVGGNGYAAEAAAKDVVKVDKAQFEKLLGSANSFSYPVLGAISDKANKEITADALDDSSKAKAQELKYRGIETDHQ